MLKTKNIVYGFSSYTTPKKPKYIISLYRSKELNIVAVFTTSQKRSGTTSPKHGGNKRKVLFLHSPLTPEKYKKIFDKILSDYYS